jgi:hypothetical protein
MATNYTGITIAKPRKLQVSEGKELIARTINDFENGNHRGGPRGALMQFDAAGLAKFWLRSTQFRKLCSELNLPSDTQELRTTCEVGERISRAKRRIEDAEAFSLLYVVTMLDGADFESFVQWGRSAEGIGADELREGIVKELVGGRKPFREADH